MTEFTFAIQQLIKAGDWETLAGMLRNTRKSADLRKQAALALAEIQAPEGGEALLEAIFKDPTQEVRDAAFEALKDLVGPDTSRLAMETYGEDPAPLGEDLEEAAPEADNEDLEDVSWDATDEESSFLVQRSIEVGDVQVLADLLRDTRKPAALRKQAALALAELQKPEGGDALLDAIFKDPSQEVRDAALEALNDLVGPDTTRLAVETYGEEPAPLDGDTEEETPGTEHGDLGGVRWNAADMVGLSNIISAERDPQRRIKAVRAMGAIAHMDAVNYLVYMALWEENDAVRKAAYEALQKRYGDDLDNFLAEERKAQLTSEGMTEEDLVELEDEESEEERLDVVKKTTTALQYPAPVKMAASSPVIQEENPGKGFLFALVGVVVVVLILYLIFFA